MSETKRAITVIGSYHSARLGEPEDCRGCHNADWGDYLLDGLCTNCREKEVLELRARIAKLENALDPFAQAGLRVKDMSIGERKHFHADDHISTSALIEAAAALGDPKKE